MKKDIRETREELEYCENKPCYDKRTAQTAKNKRWKESHIKLRIYHCPNCNHWHLTSKPYIKYD